MSKEARALLKKINDMKNAIRGLQGQGKTQEMKDKMDQLREMQQEFDIMMEMDEDEIDAKKVSIGSRVKIRDLETKEDMENYSNTSAK